MQLQLYWQNLADAMEIRFVAQYEGEITSKKGLGRALYWADQVIAQRIKEMPYGWCPMLCTDRSLFFDHNVADTPHIKQGTRL